ncbi:MAG: hypothetical protein ABI278_05800 [Candidatus Aquilonibacter sp.]
MNRTKDLGTIGAATIGTGAALTAGIASGCCVGPALAPIFLSALGASGLAAATGLRPYAPWLLLGSGLMLAFSFWQSYWKLPSAIDGSTVPISNGVRVARAVTWIAAFLWLASAMYSLYGFLNE